jgi:hypothetical protein
MSSTTFKDIIARLPDQQQTIENIGHLLERSGTDAAYTADELYDRVGAPSMTVLRRILVAMLDLGVLDTFMVVYSPTGAGLGEYQSVKDIPREIRDPYSPGGAILRVHPSDVKVFYKRHA